MKKLNWRQAASLYVKSVDPSCLVEDYYKDYGLAEEVNHAISASTDDAAGKYLKRAHWGEPYTCAKLLRRAVGINA